MATMFDFGFLQDSLRFVSFLNQDWLVMLFLTVLLTFAISRRPRDFQILFLPVLIGLKLSGLYLDFYVYTSFVTVGVIMFLVGSLSIEIVGSGLRSAISFMKEESQRLVHSVTNKDLFREETLAKRYKEGKLDKLDALSLARIQAREQGELMSMKDRLHNVGEVSDVMLQAGLSRDELKLRREGFEDKKELDKMGRQISLVKTKAELTGLSDTMLLNELNKANSISDAQYKRDNSKKENVLKNIKREIEKREAIYKKNNLDSIFEKMSLSTKLGIEDSKFALANLSKSQKLKQNELAIKLKNSGYTRDHIDEILSKQRKDFILANKATTEAYNNRGKTRAQKINERLKRQEQQLKYKTENVLLSRANRSLTSNMDAYNRLLFRDKRQGFDSLILGLESEEEKKRLEEEEKRRKKGIRKRIRNIGRPESLNTQTDNY